MPDSPTGSQTELEMLERKHAANPDGRFFVPLANAYRKAGAVEHAEALLRDGLQRHPDYLSAHIVLGRCLADRGATREAEDEFQYVLTLDPQNLIALRTLGEIARDEGRADDAARWYDELLAVDPMNEEARRELEALRGEEGDEPEPDAEFESGGAWWEKPEQEEADGEGGEVIAAAGAEEIVAEEPYETETAEKEEPEVVTETIAELYARQGFTDRAADVYRELIRRRGGDPALERRLAELERPAVEIAPDVAEPEEALAAEPAPATDELILSDPFADSFADGFGTPEPEPMLEDEPEPQPASISTVQSAPGIRAYLGELLAWSPGPAQPEMAAPAPEPEPGPPTAEVRFPWELSHSEPAQAQSQEPEAAGEAEELYSFDAFLGEPEPEPESQPEKPAEEEEEDDLESFQAWLRSLKR